jgi:alginate O-acetyltransferase complex protein AlgI
MSLNQLLIFTAAAGLAGLALKGRGRAWFLLIASILALYWLQPSTPIRNLDFWLPTASLALAAWVWGATRPEPRAGLARADGLTLAVLLGLVLLIALDRYVDACCLTPSRPPDVVRALIGLAGLAGGLLLAMRAASRPRLIAGLTLGFILLFVALKTDVFSLWLAQGLRAMSGQSPEQATALDVRWLGFSYLAFRLIHALRERGLGKLPDLTLQEFLIFAVFAPAVTAGPIDRAERFVKDLRAERGPAALGADFGQGAGRILWGTFKKYAVADTLALAALSPQNAAQIRSPGWLWVVLYAYALRIYFDFSGYTDIALGLGRLLGIKLPENFDRPYLKQNLTTFWNSWHMSLAQWFRAYYFNPVTRALRSRHYPAAAIIFFTQFSTMLLIGLWHGVAWNFVAWGAWHGLGLFAHNRWSDFVKPRAAVLESRPWLKRAAAWSSVLLTFHYVLLGWVWFALPDIGLAGRVMLRLFGAR